MHSFLTAWETVHELQWSGAEAEHWGVDRSWVSPPSPQDMEKTFFRFIRFQRNSNYMGDTGWQDSITWLELKNAQRKVPCLQSLSPSFLSLLLDMAISSLKQHTKSSSPSSPCPEKAAIVCPLLSPWVSFLLRPWKGLWGALFWLCSSPAEGETMGLF